mmetsp:Transcript_35443/g.75462  ORF Transcript_35443/g.75462 Transcript_35443/m.75462 type:complete len:202 (+) Transcript_35443:66-671(+)
MGIMCSGSFEAPEDVAKAHGVTWALTIILASLGMYWLIGSCPSKMHAYLLPRDVTRLLIRKLSATQSKARLPSLIAARIDAYVGNNDLCHGLELLHITVQARDKIWADLYQEFLLPGAQKGLRACVISNVPVQAHQPTRPAPPHFLALEHAAKVALAKKHGVKYWRKTTRDEICFFFNAVASEEWAKFVKVGGVDGHVFAW